MQNNQTHSVHSESAGYSYEDMIECPNTEGEEYSFADGVGRSSIERVVATSK